MLRISVFGLGYVGSVTAACLARSGHDVTCVDVDADKVAMANRGASPVVEPGLDELMHQVVAQGRLMATTSAATAIGASDLALVCVGTPGRDSGQLDMGSVVRVIRDIGGALAAEPKPYTVVLRSTVLPGTTEEVVVPTLHAAAGHASAGLAVAVNPEFMREGSSLQDFADPPITLVGATHDEPVALLRSLYGWSNAPFVATGIRSAEMVKYAANAFHALKVCFANELGDMATVLGADPEEVMRIFLMDRKLTISDAYLKPGFAFGGSCLPKDLKALLYAARTRDVSLPLLSSILPANTYQVHSAISTVLATRKRRIGVLGLSFKAGTDDLRESPLVALVEALIGKGCQVRVLDRNVTMARLVGANRRYIEEEIPHIGSLLCDSVDELLQHAEIVVIGNRSPEALEALARATPAQTVIDLTRRGGMTPASTGETT